jgi:hypothetical protein
MKVLLTHPLPAIIVDMPPRIPDLGLGYLASSLKREGFEVTILD